METSSSRRRSRACAAGLASFLGPAGQASFLPPVDRGASTLDVILRTAEGRPRNLGGGVVPPFHCVESVVRDPSGLVSFCPAGSEGSLWLRIERSQRDMPERATEQGRPAVGTPRCSPPSHEAEAVGRGQRHPTAGRPLGARTLRRHLSSARGAACPHPLAAWRTPPVNWW